MESLKNGVSLGKTRLLFYSIIVIFSLLTSSFFIIQLPAQQSKDQYSNDLEKEDFGVIYVKYDSDFEVYGFPGNGSKTNPYIIQNYDLYPGMYQNGIRIEQTTKHFIIRNCRIVNSYAALQIQRVQPNTARIINCTIINARMGMETLHTDHMSIINNTLIDCSLYGIAVDEGDEVIDNYLNGASLLCYGSRNCTIKNNVLENAAIQIYSLSGVNKSCIIENNTVNNKRIGFFKDELIVTISKDYGQIYIYNCTNVEISHRDLGFSFLNTFFQGITIRNCKNVSIFSNEFYSKSGVLSIYDV
ncbi:MAG: right-handed parallel beta-helix repeat-containing protein, partial [Candidatus Heimdallarchaeaceae archaeon]